MKIVVYLGKVLVIISWLLTIKMVLDYRKNHTNVKIKFDVFSSIEISFAIGLSLVALLAIETKETNWFNLALSLIAIIWVNFQRYRIIVASDDSVLINGGELKYNKIVRAYPQLVFLCITTKNKQFKVFSPLTCQEITQTIYDSVK